MVDIDAVFCEISGLRLKKTFEKTNTVVPVKTSVTNLRICCIWCILDQALNTHINTR